MVRQMQLLLTALSYAKFSDKDIEAATKRMVNVVGTDLQEAGYEESHAGEHAAQALEEALNEADQGREDLDDTVRKAQAGELENDEDETVEAE